MRSFESVATAARARVREATEERKRVLNAVRAGGPLDAELNMPRKVSRIQAVTGVSRQQAESMARYGENPANFGLAEEARLGAERIQGRTADFVGISFLELARAAASTVGRVVFRDLQPQGSGFMISDRLFLTNNHVIAHSAEARQFLVEFNHELDVEGRPKATTRFELAPEELFLTNAEDQLDFTVVAIGERVSGAGDLLDFGYCPLIASGDKHVLGEFVNVVQHPEGNYKQVVLRENQLVTRFDTVLHYMADTMPGSSGSPVFNDQWEVIALHHWGEPFTEDVLPDGRRDVNEGIRISAIVNALESEKRNVSRASQTLIEAALHPRLRRPSSLPDQAPRPEPAPQDRPDTGHPEITPDGAATWTVPLEVSVRLGGTAGPAAPGQTEPVVVTEELAPPREAIRIDRNYSNRRGYNRRFLPGRRVNLPRLSTEQEDQAARKLHVAAGENPYELEYQHFSIVMNARRRMAFFTAVNIDGATWIDIDRDTGEPREAAEEREVWFDDPRIAPKAQTEQSLYDNQRPRHVFDRGHLVRRQDPIWGTPGRAKRANADTFHFTNCTPQEATFNRRSQYWQGIENYVLDNAKADSERVSVFTGPVFTDEDPDYRYVKVPMRFWKILVRVESGQLLATALLADQSERIQQLPERLS
jgi:endonuclease G